MKKIYMKPNMDVVRVRIEQVLAAESLNNNAGSGETVDDPNDVLGNEGGSVWDED